MAALLGGMFSGQPPGPPPPPPGLPGQAKRLQLSVQKPEQVIKEDVSELRNELQQKDALVQKHLTKLRHWQQELEDINVQDKKPVEVPQCSLAYLEQASANIPAPLKQT
ncbi:Mediator of RNA polymerase II transcription subunit 28 [Sciurus carolinensis]|uniref:Mediator of RNA polymerase II transcription subunit 28 n=1 Tax=Sciurus carolinensis TaxID=30640 RepID=A0AA41NHA1_SCICA|nr:Mediator of RNA polymerase II transcription subunit 28 [Sciurus carolinensis]